MNPIPRPQPKPSSKDVSEGAGLSSLPAEKEPHVHKLMREIGAHADQGTEFVVRSLAKRLPESSLAKVVESLRANQPVDRARYAVGALQSEFSELVFRTEEQA